MTAATWHPPGPIGQAYTECEDPIALLQGPVGSGKTTCGLMRGLVQSYLWPRAPDGVRRVRFGVIRRLYKDLEKTTMVSWNQWFPRTMGVWRGAAGDPATHDLVIAHPGDGGRIELRVEFIALGDLRVEEAMRGWEGSFAFLDEVDLMLHGTLAWVWSRCGRYPRETLRHNPRRCWSSCNAPEFDSWVIEDFHVNPKTGHVLYRQPGGLEPGAENLTQLAPDFYQELARVLPLEEKRRLVDNLPGVSRAGEAVYPEFNDALHMSATPLAVLDSPVILGMDAGGTPAAGFWQRASNGQWRKLRELSTHAKDMGSVTGPTRFGEEVAHILAEHFRGLPVRGLADPSAAYGADTANGESTWIDTVARIAGISVMPAPSNDPTPRQEALRLPMTRLIDGRTPGLLIDPVCTLTRRALSRDYIWPTIRFAGQTRRADRPLKNWASHLVDADQYALLDGGAYHEVTARRDRRTRALAPVVAKRGFNIFATHH